MKNLKPTLHIAINKSRIKQYNKSHSIPSYYLKKSSEFQLEIFNPTQDYILAKFSLNNKLISNSGLVLRPGERVFLDRYLDIDKKFLFDTYTVSGSDEVKEAIRNNGDIKVEFYKEKPLPPPYYYYDSGITIYDSDTYTGNICGTTLTSNTIDTINVDANSYDGDVYTYNTTSVNASVTLDGMSPEFSRSVVNPPKRKTKKTSNPIKSLRAKKSKKIETGRVEVGSQSNQQLKNVDREFEMWAFHIVSYKLLPLSQKNVETSELKKLYCTNCGCKVKKNDKYCACCGQKQ